MYKTNTCYMYTRNKCVYGYKEVVFFIYTKNMCFYVYIKINVFMYSKISVFIHTISNQKKLFLCIQTVSVFYVHKQ